MNATIDFFISYFLHPDITVSRQCLVAVRFYVTNMCQFADIEKRSANCYS